MLNLVFFDIESAGVPYKGEFVEQWKFPCGEAGIKLTDKGKRAAEDFEAACITLNYESDGDLFALGQLVDALKSYDVQYISLHMPYFPYSRQDRRCNLGEGHALKVLCRYLNSLGLHAVGTNDIHSNVPEALIDCMFINMTQAECAMHLPKFDVLIAPDTGAEKKIFKHKQVAEGTEVICASKMRNAEGKITSVYLPFGGKVEGKRVCIVDDLCDGGATFLELGKVVKEFKPAEMCLYVTHGMFTNPEKFVELNDLFDRIFVHNMSIVADSKYAGYVEKI